MVKCGLTKLFFHRSFGIVYLLLPNKEREWIRLPTLKTTASTHPFQIRNLIDKKMGKPCLVFNEFFKAVWLEHMTRDDDPLVKDK